MSAGRHIAEARLALNAAVQAHGSLDVDPLNHLLLQAAALLAQAQRLATEETKP